MVDAIVSGVPAEALAIVDDLISRGHDLRNYCRDLLSLLRDILVMQTAGDAPHLLETAMLDAKSLKQYAEVFSSTDLLRLFNSLADTETKLRDASQSRYVLEMGLVKLIEIRRLKSLEEILNRLGGTEIDSDAASALKEKKTLKSNNPPQDAPFPTSSSAAADESNAVEDLPEQIDTVEQSIEEELIEEPSDLSPLDRLRKDILNNSIVRLPPIESEELEHVDDGWLDGAYETKLALSGDDRLPIQGAKAMAVRMVGFDSDVRALEAASTVETPRRIISVQTPEFEEIDVTDVPETPSIDATEEELRAYAERHPLVRQMLRTFRGKITKVSRN
jgi:DNA polymerase III gamma/tau subunit